LRAAPRYAAIFPAPRELRLRARGVTVPGAVPDNPGVLLSYLRRAAPWPWAATALCLALAGCTTGPPPPVSAQELEAAETFPYYKVYWVGHRFKQVPLTAVDGLASYAPANGETVYYGDCQGHASLLGEGTCKLPLQITSVIYVPRSNDALGAQRNTLIRGVPAAIYEGGRAVVLYTGHLAIKVSAQTPAAALRAIRVMRPVNAPGSAGDPLPPPTYCPSLYGPIPRREAGALARLPDHACQLSVSTEEGGPP
jgi:hypothetical protein